MSDPGSDIMVGTVGDRVCVRVEGKGTHLNSQSLREFLFLMLEKGYKDFRLDLNQCTYMDSTFLGMLVGVCLRLRNANAQKLTIVRISPRNLELLQTLGIEPFFQIETDSQPAPKAPHADLHALPDSDAPADVRAQTMIEAHEALSSADERNVCRFQDVITFLKQDLARLKAEQPPPADPSKPSRG